ncbi:hypothetical protein ACWPM1_07745 [Tsuneonella sp. HG249]
MQSIGPVSFQPASTAQYLTNPDRIITFGDTFYRGVDRHFFETLYSLSDFSLQFVHKVGNTNPEVTYGFTDYTRPCFFVGGLPSTTTSALQREYIGTVDGLSQTPSRTSRLFQSYAEATFDTALGVGIVKLHLGGYPSIFESPTTQTISQIAIVEAALAVNGDQLSASTVSGLGGYAGTMSGMLVGQQAMALVFHLQASDGSVVWGIVALDNESCSGCWDY